LVPGACHGGWWYQPLVDKLVAEGHQARAITLAGLDPDQPPSRSLVTLTDHVDQVTAAVQEADGEVVLVGHSYGGLVISGAADRVTDRVRALVYLDGFLPEDGDTAWSLTNDAERAWYIEESAKTGAAVEPRPFFDPRTRPHPLATLVQRLDLTGSWRKVPVKHYAIALDWPGDSPHATSYARARAAEDVVVHEWPTRHNVMHDGPDRVYNLLTAV
jgi:pimeloyl-ACP methyl ester carboxylesterase